MAEGVYGWDGEVEIHHQESSTPYGWSRYWKNKWNNLKTSRTYLTTLSDVHKAEPPELTGYVEGESSFYLTFGSCMKLLPIIIIAWAVKFNLDQTVIDFDEN